MAAAVLFLWPLIGLVIFTALGAVRGLIWTTMVGYLFLPEALEFDLPALPPYDKVTALTLSLLLPALFYWRRVQTPTGSGSQLASVLLALCLAVYVLSAIGTVWINGSPIIIGDSFRPGMSSGDVISMTSRTIFTLMPAILAWRFLRGAEAHRILLETVVVLGLVYSFLVLFEWRMSPQLHSWVYGYFPHSWTQHLRGDGFRPVVFLRHGLWVGLFLYMAVIAAVAMAWQTRDRARAVYMIASAWMMVILLMSSNLGATLMALMFLPIILLLSARQQLWCVTAVATLILSYPGIRESATMPLNTFAAQIEKVAPDRAQSFQFRLDNETALLERASEKPLFGWGSWGRARVFDERGRDISVTDGLWIIIKGERGWIGYLGYFGLLAIPLLFLGRAHRNGRLEPATIGIAVILAGNLLYTIPNSALSPISWLMIGALAGLVTRGSATDEASDAVPRDKTRPSRAPVGLTRFPEGLPPGEPVSGTASRLIDRSPSSVQYRRDSRPTDA